MALLTFYAWSPLETSLGVMKGPISDTSSCVTAMLTSAPLVLAAVGAEAGLNSPSVDAIVSVLGLRAFYCASTALGLAELFKNHLQFFDPGDKAYFGEVPSRCAPTNESLYGEFSRNAFRAAIPLMFKGALLQDYLDELGFAVSARTITRLMGLRLAHETFCKLAPISPYSRKIF